MSVDKAVDSTVLDGYFSDIADAIRGKNGSASTYSPSQMATAIDNIPSGGTYQTISKSYTPTESAQSETITSGAGYDAIEEVDVSVGAISSTYVGSGITRRDSSSLSASGASVSVPSGYYENNASKSVSSGSATPTASITATGATVSTGTNTLTLSKTVSNTPQVSAGYVSSGTAGNTSVSLTGSVTTQGSQTIHPSTSNQTITSGKYLTGTQTFNAVTTTNLTADNIKSGVTVKIGDSTDDDCVASILGTYSGGGGGGSPTLVQTTSYDKLIHADEGVTIPSYTTTTQTLKAASNLGNVTVDYDYAYFGICRSLAYPIYSSSSKYAGKLEYTMNVCLYEIFPTGANYFASLDNASYSSTKEIVTSNTSMARTIYWNSSPAKLKTATSNYGVYITAGGVGGTSTTSNYFYLKSPTCYAKGATTYYNQTAWNETTDMRFQWVVEVYKTPRANAFSSPYTVFAHTFEHIMSCAISNSHKLT